MLDSRKVGRVHCLAIMITSQKWHACQSLVLHTELILKIFCFPVIIMA
uniref:Uncharacterized protein n=1 Tax=Arundo donax TaxID=35708 RepID=A0A0A9QRF1_ARUDO